VAIWNYRAELIPRKWIIQEYGEIPSILDREETIEMALERDPNCLQEEPPESRWAGIDYPADFIARAAAILQIVERTPTFIRFGFSGYHRIELWLDGERPDLISIKLNLTRPELELFSRIAGYAHDLDTLIVPSDRFTAVNPDLNSLLADIRESRAYRFCSDPGGTFEQFSATQSRP